MHGPGPVKRAPTWAESLNCDGRLGLWLLGAVALLVLPELAGDPGRLALRYDRAALASGELWRLLSAHVVHLSLRHALVNAAGLVLLWALFARDYAPRAWLLITLAALLTLDAGLWFLDQTVAWYVGSSGVLHGLLAAGTVAHLKRRDREGVLLLVLLLGKLTWEQLVGPLPFSGSPEVVVDAHLYGVVGGAAAALALKPRPRPL